jgi:hypothetical protein
MVQIIGVSHPDSARNDFVVNSLAREYSRKRVKVNLTAGEQNVRAPIFFQVFYPESLANRKLVRNAVSTNFLFTWNYTKSGLQKGEFHLLRLLVSDGLLFGTNWFNEQMTNLWPRTAFNFSLHL